MGRYQQFETALHSWWAFALLLVLVTVIQAPALQNGFVYDDDLAIVNNSLVTQARYTDIWTSDIWGTTGEVTTGTYRPLMVTSFALQWAFSPNSSFSFHLVNLILLLLTLTVLFLFLRDRFPVPIAWLAVAGLALHPVNSEVFYNIVQRSELMAALFGLGYLHCTLPANGREPSLARQFIGLFLLVFALFSKENAIVFPALFILLAIGLPDASSNWKQRIRRMLPVMVASLVLVSCYLVLRHEVLQSFSREVSPTFNPTVVFDPFWRHANSAWLALRYVLRYLWPLPQPMEWTYNQLPVFGAEGWAFLLMIWLVVLGVGWVSLKGVLKQSYWALGVAWFALAIAPVVQALVTVTVLFADRCMFLPGIGLSIAGAYVVLNLFQRWAGRRQLAWLLFAPLLLFGAWAQLQVQSNWSDNLTLFRVLAQNSDRCANAQAGYGKFLFANGNLELAEQQFSRAAHLAPSSPGFGQWLGRVQLQRGKLEEALKTFQIVREGAHPLDRAALQQEQIQWIIGYGFKLLESNAKQALMVFDEVLRIDKQPYDAWLGRAVALCELKKNEQAKVAIVELQRRFPDQPENAANLARLYDMQEEFQQALVQYDLALSRKPGDADIRRKRAIILRKLGRGWEALEELGKLLRENPNDHEARQEFMRLRGATDEEFTRKKPFQDVD